MSLAREPEVEDLREAWLLAELRLLRCERTERAAVKRAKVAYEALSVAYKGTDERHLASARIEWHQAEEAATRAGQATRRAQPMHGRAYDAYIDAGRKQRARWEAEREAEASEAAAAKEPS